jgi:2-keto-4-pentenoate hydratase/2-oxohepta-3-ene-1,7-dioic acid hydratase in catechol pathway
MKIVNFMYKGRSRVGLLEGDQVYAASWQESLTSLIMRGLKPERVGEHFPVDEVELRAPVQPGKIIAIGRNYAAHAGELGNDLPEKPLLFAKLISSVIATGDTVTWDTAITTQVDWECELAVVIGKRASRVAESDAMKHVFGYTAANDVSARDLQKQEPQWLRAKGLNTFCPLGPCIVTRDEIPDPHALSLKTTVNGEVMQDGNTADMIFKIPHLVSFISQSIALEPGDLILTGTPSGVGSGMNPPRFLADGDEVSVTVEGIGTLTNPCRAITA